MGVKLSKKKTSEKNEKALLSYTHTSEKNNNSEQLEAEYKSLFDLAPNGIVKVDLKGFVQSCNEAFVQMTGYSREEIIGRHFSNLPTVRAKDVPKYFKIVASILAGEKINPFEFDWVHRDGSKRLGEIHVSLIKVNGHINGIMAVLWDITEREKTTISLRESEKNLRTYLESAPDAVYISDLKGTLLYGNRKVEAITGFKREELIGKNFMELNILPPKSLAKTAKLLAIGMMGKSTGPDELEIRKKDGSLISVEVSSTPIKEQGRLVAIGFVRDISDRVHAKRALQESEQRYRLLIENSNEAIVVAQDGMLKFANAKTSDLSGYSVKELASKPFIELVHPDDKDMVEDYYTKRLKGNTLPDTYSFRFVRGDGTIGWAEVNGVQITWEDKPASLNFITDITERKKAEENLEQSFEKLRKTVSGTIDTIATIVEKRDPLTAGHQQRVAKLAAAIAKELSLPEEQVEALRVAGLLHDIGKVEVPVEILNKTDSLSDIEYRMVKYHAEAGYNILKNLELPWDICPMVLQHHERLDGSGYPEGISGQAICLGARILAVAETVEAMSSLRPYRPPLAIDETLQEISQNKGILYDADVVDACLRLFNEKGFVFK